MNGTLTQTNMGVGRVALQVLGTRDETISSLLRNTDDLIQLFSVFSSIDSFE